MCDHTHAGGQMLGYMIQARHMLSELISVEDFVVSAEMLDDVAVEQADGTVIAEQLKSVLSSGNPVTDRSPVFWKTFYNWFNYVKEGKLSITTTKFKMIVISNKHSPIGAIAKSFARASTQDEAQLALAKAKTVLWGVLEENKDKIPATYSSYLDILFAPTNERSVLEIITRFQLEVYSEDYEQKLKAKFDRQLMPEEFSDNLFTYMLGWVYNRICKLIRNGETACISSKEYRKEINAQIRMYDQGRLIPPLSVDATDKEISEEVSNKDVYIRQLEFINMDLDDKLEAASDYLRTKSEESIRAERGLITSASVGEYENRLAKIWKSKTFRIGIGSNITDEEKGRLLYGEMIENATEQEFGFPSFYGSGKLHALANEPKEAPRIGWHPKYKELIKGGDASGEK